MTTTASKRSRFHSRVAEMFREGWIHFPDGDLFVEKVSVQVAKWSPTGRPRFLQNCRRVYGREVFEASERTWRDYLDGHPLAILALDAQWKTKPAESGLLAADAFAVHDKEPVR